MSHAFRRIAAQPQQAFQGDTGMFEQVSQALRGMPAQQAIQANEAGMCPNSSKVLVSNFVTPLRHAREVRDSHVLSGWQIHDLHSCSHGLGRNLSLFHGNNSRAGVQEWCLGVNYVAPCLSLQPDTAIGSSRCCTEGLGHLQEPCEFRLQPVTAVCQSGQFTRVRDFFHQGITAKVQGAAAHLTSS